MKKIAYLLLILFINLLWLSFVEAKSILLDDQITDQMNNLQEDEVKNSYKELNEKFKFESFNSCQNLESVFEDYLSKYMDNYGYQWGYPVKGWVMIMDEKSVRSLDSSVESPVSTMQVQDMDRWSEWSAGAWVVTDFQNEPVSQTIDSSTTDYSQTNIQVKWVDEPEILKTDWKNLYYYNSKYRKIYIIDSPLDLGSSKIDMQKVVIRKIINIPTMLLDIQLFLYKNRLIIAWNKYASAYDANSIMDKSVQTIVIIYDITDLDNLNLLKMYNMNGSYFDARMIWSHLYMISKVNFHPYYAFDRGKLFGFIDVQRPNFEVNDLIPRSIEFSRTDDKSKQNLIIKGKTYPYNIDIRKIWCNNIFYLLPSEESLKRYSILPSFALVSEIDVQNTEQLANSSALFWDVSQIHMSQDSLYITNNFYMPYNFRCPMFARCILPHYDSWENTLIHKFVLGDGWAVKQDDVGLEDSLIGTGIYYMSWWSSIQYMNSNIIPWLPLSQYSMSEDENWFFRILTKKWSPQLSTDLYILDKDIEIHGKLTDIEPWEEFKSSRFIWDKLYLVTFKQIDPLFVIDMQDNSNPKIIWELKIPWYSTYIHPYADMEDWVQYLIWLWYDTKENQWWWVVNNWLKIDIYKVNYNSNGWSSNSTQNLNSYIDVEQLYSKSLTWTSTWTEALENPRLFVWDQRRKILLLPVLIWDYNYYWNSNTGNFIWLKWYTLDLNNGIIESISKDYSNYYKKQLTNWNYMDQWWFRNLSSRVWYLWDVIYNLNIDFAHLFILWNNGIEKTLFFDENFIDIDNVDNIDKVDKTENTADKSRCSYIPPKSWQPICEMYCWQRWVLWDWWQCINVQIDSSCSCPWFDSKSQCEKSCK